MESKNLTIGVLSITAAILLVGIVVVLTRPQPAIAAGMSAAGGDYIIAVGTGIQLDEEYVYVVDVPAMKMLAYRFDSNRGAIEIVHGVDVGALRQNPPGQPAPTPQPAPSRSRRP